MLKTYEGKFIGGKFVSPDISELPEGVKVFVTVTGNKETPFTPEEIARRGAAFRAFCENMKNDEEKITDEDIEWLQNNRPVWGRELDNPPNNNADERQAFEDFFTKIKEAEEVYGEKITDEDIAWFQSHRVSIGRALEA